MSAGLYQASRSDYRLAGLAITLSLATLLIAVLAPLLIKLVSRPRSNTSSRSIAREKKSAKPFKSSWRMPVRAPSVFRFRRAQHIKTSSLERQTELCFDASLFVIARNSTFTYKGRAVDIKQVGRELGVRYILEGSVRRSAGHPSFPRNRRRSAQ